MNPDEPVPLSDEMRRCLGEARAALLQLHKAIMEFERTAYEKINGRVEAGELLRLLTDDAWFSWLRPLSEFVVQLDELLDSDELVSARQIADLVREVRSLLQPSEDGEEFGVRYYEVLQQDPNSILAHAEVQKRLTGCLELQGGG